MPSLLLDRDQAGSRELRKVPARGLRCDAGELRELGGRQRAPVHHRYQHIGPRGIARQRGNFGKRRIAHHGRNSGIVLGKSSRRPARMLRPRP